MISLLKKKSQSISVIRFSAMKKSGERERLVEFHMKDSFGAV